MIPRVTILILNWNGLQDTLACLASLQCVKYPNFDILVVDNGSCDGSTTVIRERFPEVRVIENERNLGFTGGNNVGLRHLAQGVDYVLLLNNDTEVAPDFLGRLVDVAEADPGIGIVGPKIYYHEQPVVIWSAGGTIDWQRGKSRMLELDELDEGQSGVVPREVDFVSGCALLVKRAVLEQIGLLDERFFAYYEEIEWCVRAKREGFKIVHVPRAKVWHKIPLDARDSSPIVQYYMSRNRILFLKATGAPCWVYMQVLFAEYLPRIISWSVKPRWRHKRSHRAALIRAIADAGLGRWGAQRLH